MSVTTTLLPLQPDAMTPAQLAAVSYPARYSRDSHALYAYQLRRWFGWCESNGLDALVGVQRAHVELYVRYLRDCGLRDSSICAHIDGSIPADPAVYVRLPKIHADETRTQGLDRLELIRFPQVAQTITVHHGALAYLLGINALRASEAAAVRIEDYADTLRGHRVLHLVGKGSKPATMPLTVPVPRATSARIHCDMPRSPTPSTPASRSATRRSSSTRRPPHHRALRPRPRQPRPTRRPLPHRPRRRRLSAPPRQGWEPHPIRPDRRAPLVAPGGVRSARGRSTFPSSLRGLRFKCSAPLIQAELPDGQ
jgi:hypothetical protein